MLSPSTEETLAAYNRVERGKRRTYEQEGSTFELFSLLLEMTKEMKRRDEQFRKELRWRYENLSAENRTREENFVAILSRPGPPA